MGERTTHLHTCTLCEAMCGLEITVEDGRVALIRADREDVWSKGYLCPKGTTLGKVHEDPDRVRQPAGPRRGQLAGGDLGRGLRPLRGAPAAGDRALRHRRRDRVRRQPHGAQLLPRPLRRVLIGMSGIPMIYSSGTVDQWPKNLSSQLMYGGMWTFPIPDVPRTDLWIVMGANPHASQGSLLACPDLLGQIDRIRAAGGRTIVVDPRRTGTADRADEWIPIVPGTDAALLLGMVNVLFADGLVDLGHLAALVNGVDDARRSCAASSRPRWSRATCGVPAERIRALAHELADDRTGRALRPDRPVQPGVRVAGLVAGRRRQHPDPALRHAGRADVPQAGRVGAQQPAPARPGRLPAPGGGAAGCAAPPRCSARCRCRAWPRRSTRPARASSTP